MYWDWLNDAIYVGQRDYHEVIYDEWAFVS